MDNYEIFVCARNASINISFSTMPNYVGFAKWKNEKYVDEKKKMF